MVYVKLFGEAAESVARRMEELGKLEPWKAGTVMVDARVKVTCRSVEGRSVTELEIEFSEAP